MFGRAVFEVIEVKGDPMVKKQDFEAEKKSKSCKKIKYPTFLLCLASIYVLEMGQKQQSMLDQKLFQPKCDIRQGGLDCSFHSRSLG